MLSLAVRAFSPATGAMSISEAERRGLFDRDGGTFRDPASGRSVPVSEALSAGMLRLSSEWPAEQAPGAAGGDPEQRRTDVAVLHQKGEAPGPS